MTSKPDCVSAACRYLALGERALDVEHARPFGHEDFARQPVVGRERIAGHRHDGLEPLGARRCANVTSIGTDVTPTATSATWLATTRSPARSSTSARPARWLPTSTVAVTRLPADTRSGKTMRSIQVSPRSRGAIGSTKTADARRGKRDGGVGHVARRGVAVGEQHDPRDVAGQQLRARLAQGLIEIGGVTAHRPGRIGRIGRRQCPQRLRVSSTATFEPNARTRE